MKQKGMEIRRRNRAEWIEMVGRYQASGLDRASFCAGEGVNAGTFAWWACKLGREGSVVVASSRVVANAPPFMPVRVLGRTSSAPLIVRSEESLCCVELTLSHGAILRLDPERLSERGIARVAALAKELCQ